MDNCDDEYFKNNRAYKIKFKFLVFHIKLVLQDWYNLNRIKVNYCSLLIQYKRHTCLYEILLPLKL